MKEHGSFARNEDVHCNVGFCDEVTIAKKFDDQPTEILDLL